ATSPPVEARPAQIFAPKLFFGFGYQPKLGITEMPTICLEDSDGNALYLEQKPERASPTSALLIKAFGLKKSLEIEAPVPKTNLKVRILASTGEILREPMRQLYVPLGGEMLLVALLAVLLYPFAASQIAYPLRSLAKRLSEFDPTKKEDELGKSRYTTLELAEIVSSFEAMAERIRETLSELEKKVKEVEEKNALLSKTHQQLKWLASNDPLTGVLNRRSFMEQCLAQLPAEDKDIPPYIGVLMMDVDNFKFINDTYGHPAGDAVLKKVGELLRQCVRKDDLVGRYGGDEFVLFFAIEKPEEFHAIARRTFNHLCAELAAAAEPVSHISISMGGAITQRSAVQNLRTLEHLIGHADQLLLQSKRQGKKTLTIEFVEKF
ncbi:MAG: GGDEF domain-containing protein, partial [Thermacetogeniaceae bacterium]